MEQDESRRRGLASELRMCGYEVIQQPDLEWVGANADLICLGECGRSCGALAETICEVKGKAKGVPLILWMRERSEALLLSALRAGADDFLRADEPYGRVVEAIQSLAPARRRGFNERVPNQSLLRIVGESPAVRGVRAALPRLAASDCNLLITGETGTGKDLAAELIHLNSRRSSGPFVCLNCAALPDSLLESELFGHARGAFTGAGDTRQGKLEYANCGTIFLDEIGEMTPLAQAKILRAIESREIQKLGSNNTVPINVRIVAATNQDLAAMVAAKTFRKDLYFRLNVARVHLPALRERKQDIAILFHHFVADVARRAGVEPASITGGALGRLMEHDWPGNIRELRNLVEAIFIFPPEQAIDLEDLPSWFSPAGEPVECLEMGDREKLLEALRSTSWNKSKAAEKLNWSRMTLYRKISRYGLRRDRGILQLT